MAFDVRTMYRGRFKVLVTVVALASMIIFTVLFYNKQNKSLIVTNIMAAVIRGSTRDNRLKDLEASPVFSKLSRFGRNLRDKGLPEVIELDYKPIEIKPGMSENDAQDAIVALALQRQVICPNWEMYGLRTDGGWPVCKAKALIPQPPCTVYSFGIHYDWSFDDAYRKAHGCTIRTFDPSMPRVKTHEHKRGVFFYPIGLSNKREFLRGKQWHVDTYKGLLQHFKEQDKVIPYLKFDIETMEWDVLTNMLADGILNNVMQLAFEIHVDNLHNVRIYFHLIKRLEEIGFRRWFYHHRLNGFPFQCDQAYINMNFLNGTRTPKWKGK